LRPRLARLRLKRSLCLFSVLAVVFCIQQQRTCTYIIVAPQVARAAVLSNATITYDQLELLELVHQHLTALGLCTAAAALLNEAGLQAPPQSPSVVSHAGLTPMCTPTAARSRSGLFGMYRDICLLGGAHGAFVIGLFV
jgi:hypothetical protein